MEAQFSCHRCRTLLTIPVGDLGRRVMCPACDATFLVVADAMPAAPPPPGPAKRQDAPRKSPTPPRTKPTTEAAAPILSGCGPLVLFGGIFIALVVLIVVGGQQRAANREWFEFNGDRFAIQFPKQPTAAAPEQMQEGVLHAQALNHHQRNLAIAYIDVRKPGDADADDKWLRWAEDKLVLAQFKNPRVLRNERVKLGDHEGRELFVLGAGTMSMARVFYVDGRIYVLSIHGMRRAVRDRTIDRFFTSFKINALPAAGG